MGGMVFSFLHIKQVLSDLVEYHAMGFVWYVMGLMEQGKWTSFF
jgi:hypothetical protein